MLGIDVHETVRNLEETRWRLRLRKSSGKHPFRYIRAAASLPSRDMPLTACEGFGLSCIMEIQQMGIQPHPG